MLNTDTVFFELRQCLPLARIEKNALMKDHTSMQVGGPADIMIFAKTEEETLQAIQYARENALPITVMGKGSNLIVKDGGIRGIVIVIDIDHMKFQGEELNIGSGASLSEASWKAMLNNLAGLSFAQGIPGSIGGAIVMNAGAYDGHMADVLHVVRYLNDENLVVTKKLEESDMGYRESFFSKHGFIVLGATLILKKDIDGVAREKYEEYRIKRMQKQPLAFASAGSVFKRPEGYYAGQLIQEAGLKGYAIGDAQVSEKHAGFIINKGNACAGDILKLIHHIQKEVYKASGVQLETEVKIIGEEN